MKWFGARFWFAGWAMLFFSMKGGEAQEIPVLFEKPLSPRIANYNIDVRLDVDKKTLEGKEILIWHNKSTDSITELQFHLYLNAFRNSKSTFMQESGGAHRNFEIGEQGWGFSDVTSLKVRYGRDLKNTLQFIHPSDAPQVLDAAYDLTAQMAFIHPDDDNEHDKTVFRIPLPKSLPPGEYIAVHINFHAKLPEPPFARTGAKEEYFLVGQWFPKIGVYTDAGWNTHQFHSTSEFFADFGVYNVRITVPENNVVGATGVQVSVTQNGDGTATHFYHAEDVHDFAWTTSPEYLKVTGKIQGVDIRILMQPDHFEQAQRHLDATKLAIDVFQNQYGDYPFPNLTVVDPRRGAGGSGGMEYPTFVTAGTIYGLPDGIRGVENVIVHEFGHNYWYHLLASNESEESWMDEGITTYTDMVIEPKYNIEMVDFLGIKLDEQTLRRSGVLMGGDRDPLIRKAWKFYSRGSYAINSYGKAGLVLLTLHNYLGEDVMNQIMRTYVERWRFKHPKSQDFFDIVNEVSGKDMSWFIDQAFYTNAQLDYMVSAVYTKKVQAPEGFDYTKSTRADSGFTELEDAQVSSAQAGLSISGDEDIAENDSNPDAEIEMYHSEVRVRRIHPFVFPVEIEVVFADGEVIREHWDGKELWKKFFYTRPAKLVSATVDPERKILLDLNYTNNSKTVEHQTLGVNKVAQRLMFWFQFILDQPQFLNLLRMPMTLFN